MNSTQIEHLKNAADRQVNRRMAEFKTKFQAPESLELWELVEVAFTDPKWKPNVIKAAKKRDSWDCESQIKRDSPKAAKAYAARELKRKYFVEAEGKLAKELRDKRDDLIDLIVLENVPAKTALEMIAKL
jgi:hypothetical protein